MWLITFRRDRRVHGRKVVGFTTTGPTTYIFNQCPSPLMLRVQILIRASCTTLCAYLEYLIYSMNSKYRWNTCYIVCLMVFKATFNNISVISWRSVLLVEETGGPGENHRLVASHWQTLSHNVVQLALIKIWTRNYQWGIGELSSSQMTLYTRCLLKHGDTNEI
jgi:hypothetical protein